MAIKNTRAQCNFDEQAKSFHVHASNKNQVDDIRVKWNDASTRIIHSLWIKEMGFSIME